MKAEDDYESPLMSNGAWGPKICRQTALQPLTVARQLRIISPSPSPKRTFSLHTTLSQTVRPLTVHPPMRWFCGGFPLHVSILASDHAPTRSRALLILI